LTNNSSLFKSTVFYSIANVFPQIVNFILLPFYSRVLSTEDYGIIATVEMYTYILGIFMCLCLDRAAQRLFFDSENVDYRKKVLSTFFWSIVLISILLTGGIFLLGEQKILSTNMNFYPYLATGVIISLLNSFSQLTTIYFQLIEKPKAFVTIKLLRFFINTAFVLCTLLFVSANAEYKLLADAYALLIMLPIYLYIAYKYFGFEFDFKILKQGIVFSVPLIPTLIVAWVLGLSNRYFIDMYMGLADVGLFSMAFKIASVVGILSGSIAAAFSPMFYRIANKEGDTSASLRNISVQIIYIMIFAAFTITIFVPEVVSWFLDEKYHGIEIFINLLMFSNLLISLMSVTTVLYIMQSKNTYFNLYAGLIASIFSLIINYALIPVYGLYGAVMANVISSVILYLSQYRFAKKGFNIQLPWKNIFVLLVFITVISPLVQILSTTITAFIIKILLLLTVCLFAYNYKDKFLANNNYSNT